MFEVLQHMPDDHHVEQEVGGKPLHERLDNGEAVPLQRYPSRGADGSSRVTSAPGRSQMLEVQPVPQPMSRTVHRSVPSSCCA